MTAAVSALAMAGIEERGAIFTRREVVEFILDLVGYRADRALMGVRLLEPAFGGGDFLVPAVDRLLTAWRRDGAEDPFRKLSDCIRAVELHRDTFEATRRKISMHLVQSGISPRDAELLCEQWLLFGDFLLIDIDSAFDVVIGNPPYVRQELIADALMAEYRSGPIRDLASGIEHFAARLRRNLQQDIERCSYPEYRAEARLAVLHTYLFLGEVAAA